MEPSASALPPGHEFVTVTASTSPQGATVTGGGRFLGVTPFAAQVPVHVAPPGQTQTFEFVFQLAGYQTTSVSASPVAGQITLNAALARSLEADGVKPPPSGAPTATPSGEADEGEAQGRPVVVRGRGGAIRDHRATTSTVRVDESCTVASAHVDVDGHHTYYGDLVVSLRGPNGNYPLQSRASRNPFRRYSIRRAADTEGRGSWTLTVRDEAGADQGALTNWTLTLRCR